RAGINRLAVEFDHAFLASISVDAGKSDGKGGIAVGADPAQAVEHGLTGLEGDVETVEVSGFVRAAAPDLQRRGQAHCAAARASAGGEVSATSAPFKRTSWLRPHCGNKPGKSSRWCAPRLSVRRNAALVTQRATSSMLRRSNHSSRCMSKAPSPPG